MAKRRFTKKARRSVASARSSFNRGAGAGRRNKSTGGARRVSAAPRDVRLHITVSPQQMPSPAEYVANLFGTSAADKKAKPRKARL